MEGPQLLVALGSVLLVLLGPSILYPMRTLHWLRRKRYQYEVTFGLYMMTPTEKFILSTQTSPVTLMPSLLVVSILLGPQS